MRNWINLLEQVKLHTAFDGTRVPQLINPSRAELDMALERATHNDVRGMLLDDDSLYVMDANYSSHTDLVDEMGLEEGPRSLRVILSGDEFNVQFYNRIDDGTVADSLPVIEIIKTSKTLRRLYPSGTKVEIVLFDRGYEKSETVTITL